MRWSGATRVAGIIGWPVRHSLSPAMHQAAFEALGLNWAYAPFPVPPERLRDAVRALPALGIAGVNVTIPHKQEVMRWIDEIDPEARAIGAVNTLTVLEDGRVHGMNTDAGGFLDSLMLDGGVDPAGMRVAQAGAGGAGRAAAFALSRAGIKTLVLINRTREKAERLAADLRANGAPCAVEVVERGSADEARALAECRLLVNTTSLGMAAADPLPADPAALPAGAAVYDMVYTPADTALLRAAQSRGLKAIPGLGMLARQGARSFERWTGIKPDVEVMMRALRGKMVEHGLTRTNTD